MSKSMTHLRRMKKTELQEELRKNGVAFSSSALKPELLSLYKLKVLPSGFSTDEEEPVVDIKRSKMLSNDQEKEKRPLGPSDQVMSEARRSPRKPKKPLRLIEEEDSDKLLQDTRSSRVSVSLERLDSLMIDERSCKDLSNKELAAKLKAKGVSVGPIGPTTRRLYERKLEKISAQEVIPKREYSDQDSSEPEEGEVEIEKPTPVTRSLRKRGTGESATKRPALYSRRGVKERNVEESLSESVPPSSGTETTKPERRWLPFWVTIAIVSIIVTILYFVYITMEENPPRFLP